MPFEEALIKISFRDHQTQCKMGNRKSCLDDTNKSLVVPLQLGAVAPTTHATTDMPVSSELGWVRMERWESDDDLLTIYESVAYAVVVRVDKGHLVVKQYSNEFIVSGDQRDWLMLLRETFRREEKSGVRWVPRYEKLSGPPSDTLESVGTLDAEIKKDCSPEVRRIGIVRDHTIFQFGRLMRLTSPEGRLISDHP